MFPVVVGQQDRGVGLLRAIHDHADGPGDFDPDPCPEWSAAAPCGAGLSCSLAGNGNSAPKGSVPKPAAAR
mgnify:CR=1 FL=1